MQQKLNVKIQRNFRINHTGRVQPEEKVIKDISSLF